jgi:hypothetical protein
VGVFNCARLMHGVGDRINPFSNGAELALNLPGHARRLDYQRAKCLKLRAVSVHLGGKGIEPAHEGFLARQWYLDAFNGELDLVDIYC